MIFETLVALKMVKKSGGVRKPDLVNRLAILLKVESAFVHKIVDNLRATRDVAVYDDRYSITPYGERTLQRLSNQTRAARMYIGDV